MSAQFTFRAFGITRSRIITSGPTAAAVAREATAKIWEPTSTPSKGLRRVCSSERQSDSLSWQIASSTLSMKQLLRKGLKHIVVEEVHDPVPFEHACFATLGSIALNGTRIANVSLGERVAVVGLGLVGQLIAQLVRLQGGFVIATDLKPDRVELARGLGADSALEGGTQFREQITALTDGVGVDCVVIAAAAHSAAPSQLAVDICRDRGRIVDVGAVELTFPWYDMYRKEIQLLMARAYGPGSYDPQYEQKGQDYPLAYVRWTENRNMEEFLRLVSVGRVQIGPLVTHEFPLEDAPSAYETIMDPVINSLAVLLRYPAAESQQPASDFQPKRRIDIQPSPTSSPTSGVALVGPGN